MLGVDVIYNRGSPHQCSILNNMLCHWVMYTHPCTIFSVDLLHETMYACDMDDYPALPDDLHGAQYYMLIWPASK